MSLADRAACASRHGVSSISPLGDREWSRCGAKTRLGMPCRAAGAGFGGRCGNHGGLSSGPARSHATLVVLSGDDDLASIARAVGEPRERQPWQLAVVPCWITRQLDELSLVSPGPCAQALRGRTFLTASGRRIRGLEKRWPKLVGFRILLRLLERGRIEYGIFTERFAHELLNRERLRFERLDAGMTRIEPTALLAALRAAGQPIKKRPKPEREPRPALGWVRGGVKRIGGEP
jgi:hypothetical protein